MESTLILVALVGSLWAAPPATGQVTPGATAAPRVSGSPQPAAEAAKAKPPSREQRQKDCEHFVALLAGREKAPTGLKSPELAELAGQFPDLVICGAVARDSDQFCPLLTEAGSDIQCVEIRARLHDKRVAPASRGFVFSEAQERECLADNTPKATCSKFREAALAGDPNKCPKGPIELWCRAVVSLDKSLCARIDAPIQNQNLESKDAPQKAARLECETAVDRLAAYGKSLKELSESGAGSMKAYARAALGQANACDPWTAPALQSCTGRLPSAAPAEAPSPTAATPVPKAPGK